MLEPSHQPRRQPASAMANEQRRYAAYLLRLWRVNDAEPPVWHASLEDPHTGERIGFANLMSLYAFLEDQCAGDQEHDRSSE